MATLRIAQTIYARADGAFPPPFPFNGSSGQPLSVPGLATPGSVISLITDLTHSLPVETVAYAYSTILEAGGVDRWPMVRLLGRPVIQGQGKQVRQNLVDLIPNGLYVVTTKIQTPQGRIATFSAPFTADYTPVGNFLVWDLEGYPPFIMTDDDGVPLTADY